jgi:hypothetical protein
VIKKLLVNDGRRERELVLVERLVVGRDPTCDVSHDDALLSRRHAEFISADGGVTVRDLGSRNGIFVNGARTAERALSPGDIIQIGPLRVRYTHDGAPVSILPEDLIADGTVMMPHSKAVAPPPPPPSRSAPAGTDSNERTRVVMPIPPRMAEPLQTPKPIAAQALDKRHEEPADEDATRFIPAPRANTAVPAGMSAPAEATPRPTPAAAARQEFAPTVPDRPAPSGQGAAPESGVRTFVFIQLFALAGVVLLSALLALMMASVPLVWLALPALVAAVAAYFVANLINRRFVNVLRDATALSRVARDSRDLTL